MRITEVLQKLKSRHWYRDNIVKVERIPPRGPITERLELDLSPEVKNFLEKKQIKHLYSHQVKAINKVSQGKNLIITTSTSSGKTLCYLIPVLDSIARHPDSRALFIYPLKALTNDQYNLLEEIKSSHFKAGIYDGDTSSSRRKLIRDSAHIILTNPYELHQVLPYHFKWANFLKNLKYIVIDEAHRYRGVFGSNISNLLFRLKRILKFYSASPVFIISSASLGNALEFAFKLVGEDFVHISKDGSPQSEKTLVLWNSRNSSVSYLHQVKDIFVELLDNGYKTLCFLKTRRNVEIVKSWLEKRKDVAAYRGGYLPGVRREIETSLKGGGIKGVLSTNALELGVDIGRLDACMIVGFPSSISSFWQQAGRVGRREHKSLVIYVALEDTLEQYLLNHPEILLNPEFEKVNIEPENYYIRSQHLICASSELHLKKTEIPGDILKKLLEKKFLSPTSRGYIYIGGGRPQGVVSLENISQDLVELVVAGKVLETMDYYRALREVYPGAVYLNQGRKYLVKEFDFKNKIVELEEKELDFYTEIVKTEEVWIKQRYKEIEYGNFTLKLGLCLIKEEFLGYKIKKFNQCIGFKKLSLPSSEFIAHTLWIEFSSDTTQNFFSEGMDFAGGLHALEHLFIGLAPLVASCDRNDLGGRSYPFYPEIGGAGIFIFEAYEGGVGIVERLYYNFEEFLKIAQEHILNCRCKSGCPSCILSPKCGNNNTPLDKQVAVFILNQIFSF